MKKLVLFLVMLGICVLPGLANKQDDPLKDNLQRAIMWEDTAGVHSLLESGVPIEPYYSVYIATSYGYSDKSLDIIKDLVAHGADISVVSPDGNSVLHTATADVVKASLRHYGKLSPDSLTVRKWKLLLDLAAEKNVLYKEKKLLQAALYSGIYTTDIIKILLDSGVEVRRKDIKMAQKYANSYCNSARMKEVISLLKQTYHMQHQQHKQALKKEFQRSWLSILQDQNLWKY